MNKKENMEINYEFLHMFDDINLIERQKTPIKKEEIEITNKKNPIKKKKILSIDKIELEGLKNILEKIDNFKENK